MHPVKNTHPRASVLVFRFKVTCKIRCLISMEKPIHVLKKKIINIQRIKITNFQQSHGNGSPLIIFGVTNSKKYMAFGMYGLHLIQGIVEYCNQIVSFHHFPFSTCHPSPYSVIKALIICQSIDTLYLLFVAIVNMHYNDVIRTLVCLGLPLSDMAAIKVQQRVSYCLFMYKTV